MMFSRMSSFVTGFLTFVVVLFRLKEKYKNNKTMFDTEEGKRKDGKEYFIDLFFVFLFVLLMMINKQAITAAKALVLSFKACRSFMNMQFSPQKFSGQTHRYLKRGS